MAPKATPEEQLQKEKVSNPEVFFEHPRGHIRDRVIFNENILFPPEGIQVGLNGFGFLIKPGKPVDIPRAVLKMIDTRIETHTLQDENGKDLTKNVPRLTYTVIQRDVNIEELWEMKKKGIPVDRDIDFSMFMNRDKVPSAAVAADAMAKNSGAEVGTGKYTPPAE